MSKTVKVGDLTIGDIFAAKSNHQNKSYWYIYVVTNTFKNTRSVRRIAYFDTIQKRFMFIAHQDGITKFKIDVEVEKIVLVEDSEKIFLAT